MRAVPTTAEAKVERALELFNGSDAPAHDRRAARARSATPWVSAQPDDGAGQRRCPSWSPGSFPGTATGSTWATRPIR